ncbi:hypothetical protein ACG04Q_15200 [Roseateles sp. DXS20W]|uniref:PEP-CTERM sorting domain-containing protein n=1 Tax=Pelomonas lactea TaxID=3299030 RepID=A0ABW7GLS2_9BURK
MRAKSKFLALALTAALQPAFAAPAPAEFSFEDLTTIADANGMANLVQANYGAASGIQFTGSAWGVLTSKDCDGLVKFVPNISGCGALMLSDNPGNGSTSSQRRTLTMNFAEGFISGSSLYYATLAGADVSIMLYENVDHSSGRSWSLGKLDGTGCVSELGAFYCDWNKIIVDLKGGTARSMVVTGNDNSVIFDDFSLVRATPVPPANLPEPAGIALTMAALGALGWTRKRAAAR